MTNLQRLQMEIKGINLDQSELLIYLKENDMEGHKPYDADSATSTLLPYQSLNRLQTTLLA